MSGGSAHGGKARRPRLLVVTDRYPVDPAHSPAAWMLPHLRALSHIADIEVVSLFRFFPRIKNLILGGYDRDFSRHQIGRAHV